MTSSTRAKVLDLAGLEVPAVEITGARPGPLLTLVAGVHGCEYSSMAGLRAFVAGLDPERVSGRIVAVPVLNLPSFWGRTAFVGPDDGKNLNRCFPGDPGGTLSERLAHDAFEQLIRPSDAFVDLHAGDQPEALEPFAIYDAGPRQADARSLAVAFGARYVIRQAPGPDRAVSGSTSSAAAAAGVPAIVAEAGGCGLVVPGAVRHHGEGLLRILGSLGMIDPPPPPADPPPVELDRFLWLRAEQAGWWEPVVEVGQHVAAGAVVGTVSTLDGTRVLEEITAPADGVPMFVTVSPAVDKDGLLLGLGGSTAGALATAP